MADPISLGILASVGIGLKGLSAYAQFQDINQQEYETEIQKQQAFKQNQLKADINSVNSLQKANISYDKQLSANASMGGQGNTNFANLVNANYTTQQNEEFVNQANLNVMNLNALFKQNQEMQQLSSMRSTTTLNVIGGAIGALQQMTGDTFTGADGVTKTLIDKDSFSPLAKKPPKNNNSYFGIQNNSDYSSLLNIGN